MEGQIMPITPFLCFLASIAGAYIGIKIGEWMSKF